MNFHNIEEKYATNNKVVIECSKKMKQEKEKKEN